MIGELLKSYRTKKGMTVREMAKVLGISPSTYSRIENGKPMDQVTLLKMIVWMFGEKK